MASSEEMEICVASQLVALIFIHLHRKHTGPLCLTESPPSSNPIRLQNPFLCCNALLCCVVLKAREYEMRLAWPYIYASVFMTIQVFCTLILPVTSKLILFIVNLFIMCTWFYEEYFAVTLSSKGNDRGDMSTAVFSCVKCFSVRFCLSGGPMKFGEPVLTVIVP